MPVPDYAGGSIVNLMSSIVAGRGGAAAPYAPARELPPGELAGARHVVLLVVDGLGLEALRAARAGATFRRHLRGGLTSVFPSTTASAVTAFMTGLAPQQHALPGWFTWLRELGTVAAILPFRARLGGPAFGELGVDPRRIFDQAPLVERIGTEAHLVMPRDIVDSDFTRAYAGSAVRRGFTSLEELVAQVTALITQSHERRYIYAYWPELDALAHEHGVGSDEVARHLGELDRAFARLLESAAGSESVLIVTADHGFVDTTPATRLRLADHPALAETLMLPLCGEPRVAYCYVSPAARGRFEGYLRRHLSHCLQWFPSEALVERGYFGEGAPHARLAERIGDYTLIMREHYSLVDRLPGEPDKVHIGVHGGITSAEMLVPLVVAWA